jgi:hypothetical protein
MVQREGCVWSPLLSSTVFPRSLCVLSGKSCPNENIVREDGIDLRVLVLQKRQHCVKGVTGGTNVLTSRVAERCYEVTVMSNYPWIHCDSLLPLVTRPRWPRRQWFMPLTGRLLELVWKGELKVTANASSWLLWTSERQNLLCSSWNPETWTQSAVANLQSVRPGRTGTRVWKLFVGWCPL